MYLSVDNCFLLDKIIKTFEVAYRCYVADIMIKKFPTELNFNVGINKLYSNIGKNSIIGTDKIKSKLSKIVNSKDSKIIQNNLYEALNYCVECIDRTDYGHRQYKNDVLYVSQVIDFIFYFFQTDFVELKNNFETIEEFSYYTVKYLKVRNTLSHPASSKIFYKDMDEVCSYIKKIMTYLDNKYFWHEKRDQILKNIDMLYSSMEKNPIRINNINEIPFSTSKLVCREEQLTLLKTYLIGENNTFRRSGSVIIYGYGGVGKTALVSEFVIEIIKEINDKKLPKDYSLDFILFFSAKEEKMNYSSTDGNLYIEPIKKQVESFDDFRNRLFGILNISSWNTYKGAGIIIIDNIETFPQEDKKLLIDFIRNSPRNIQFILTSRNEEQCEDRIHLLEFDIKGGREFVNKYIDENDININLSSEEIDIIVNGSKGNTLILVLALKRLDIKKTTLEEINSELNLSKIVFDNISHELKSVSSQNLETIANFMYKNTFEQTLDELSQQKLYPNEVLKVISLYKEPVDLFSISTLSKISLANVEKICNMLSQKLILVKNGELYEINEFANKYVLAKFIPNLHEQKKLEGKIKDKKNDIKQKIKLMEEKIENVPLLKGIMRDWKPQNYIDKIAISQVFNFYQDAEYIYRCRDKNEMITKLNELEQQISEYELMTSHPYIRYQKAKIYKLFLNKLNEFNGRDIRKLISDYFEQTIIAVEYGYSFMKRTKSFASVLWLFGMFHFNNGDYPNSVRRLEESKEIFETINIYDKNYQQAVLKLCESYLKMWECVKDENYINFAEETYRDLNKLKIIDMLRSYNMSIHYKLDNVKKSS